MKSFVSKLKGDNKSSSSSSPSAQQTQYAPPSHPPPPTSPNSANPVGGHAASFYSGSQQYAPPPGPPPSAQQGRYPPPSNAGYPPPSNQGYPPPGAGGSFAPPPGPPPSVGAAFAGRENEFAQLKRYDTVLLVDDSESMEMFWDETRDALMGVVEQASKWDQDGLDLYFFNSPTVANGVADPNAIRSLFRKVEPRKSTPTATALGRVLLPYMERLERSRREKPLNLICLTDGAPNRGEEPEQILVDVAKRLDAGRFPPYQIGIQFVQIGVDDEATVALKQLDDGLKSKHGIRDYVDVTPYEAGPNGQPAQVLNAEYMLKILLGGLSRKYDNQN